MSSTSTFGRIRESQWVDIRGALVPYAVALASAATANALATALAPSPSRVEPTLFLVATVVSTRLGGRRGGLAAGLLAMLASLATTTGAADQDGARLLFALALLTVPLAIGDGVDALRALRRSARRAATELSAQNVELLRVNASLGQEMEEVQVLTEHLTESNEALLTARDDAERIAWRAARLREVTALLSEATTVAEVAAVALGEGPGAAQAVRAALWVAADDEGGPMILVGSRGWSADELTTLRLLTIDTDTALGAALRTRAPVWTHARAGDDASAAVPTAAVATPLLHRGVLVGAMTLAFDGPAARGAADEAFTMVLIGATAQALHRARSFDEERERRGAAETLARAREDVLGIVAHDLRNPIHRIGMTTQLIRQLQPPTERVATLLDVADRAVGEMNRLVGDLLDTVRLQAGRLSLELTNVPARTLLLRIEESFLLSARERGVELQVLGADTERRVRADEHRVLQVLGNLVGNALKFVPSGGHVRVELAWLEATAVFAVADTGPGIPSDSLEHLFDRFWQARRSDRRGVGLGLAIAKGIVETHGGRIWAESRPGEGSTFYFTLPAQPDA